MPGTPRRLGTTLALCKDPIERSWPTSARIPRFSEGEERDGRAGRPAGLPVSIPVMTPHRSPSRFSPCARVRSQRTPMGVGLSPGWYVPCTNMGSNGPGRFGSGSDEGE